MRETPDLMVPFVINGVTSGVMLTTNMCRCLKCVCFSLWKNSICRDQSAFMFLCMPLVSLSTISSDQMSKVPSG